MGAQNSTLSSGEECEKQGHQDVSQPLTEEVLRVLAQAEDDEGEEEVRKLVARRPRAAEAAASGRPAPARPLQRPSISGPPCLQEKESFSSWRSTSHASSQRASLDTQTPLSQATGVSAQFGARGASADTPLPDHASGAAAAAATSGSKGATRTAAVGGGWVGQQHSRPCMAAF